MSVLSQCTRLSGRSAETMRPATLCVSSIALIETLSADAVFARRSRSSRKIYICSFSSYVAVIRISAIDENNSLKYLQAICWIVSCFYKATSANAAEVNNLTTYKPVPYQVFVIPSGSFGLPCAAGALKPPNARRALPSRRSRGASEVRRRPAADAPVTGVPPKDLAAPVPAGAVLLLCRLFYSRARLRLQAVGRRAPVCVPASSSHLPHLTRSVASIFLKHGGLTECGQSRGVAAQ
ncbi:hypothetical protein FHR71_000929 [Methylobacterium sp. RAS18]|nr:hypothetical protein [Methylobacterium sp. RAS18]